MSNTTTYILRKHCSNCGEDNDKSANQCKECGCMMTEEVDEKRSDVP